MPTNETPTFDSLQPEEKRRIIAALSMGKLSPAEIAELREACRRSLLSDTERAQLNRAFAMSRLSEEERTALIARRRQAQAQTIAAQPAAPSPSTESAAPAAPKPQEPEPISQPHAQTTVQRAVSLHTEEPTPPIAPTAASPNEQPPVPPKPVQEHNAETRAVSTAAIRRQDTAAHAAAVADNAVRDTAKRREDTRKTEEPDDYEDADHTAITSLLKGIVYIVAVLVISIFAAWTIIEVANDVFAFVKSDEVVSVVIEEDMTSADVAQLLYDNGVIKYPTIYELFVRVKKESTNYLVGEYEISPSMNYSKLNDKFTYIANTREQVVITIPEGYTVDQIIDLMLKNGIGTRDGFVDAINNYEFTEFRFLDELGTTDPDRTYRLEGYLFPDTYYFFKDSSEVAVIYKFLQNFDRKITDAYYERAEQLGMSLDQVMVLASMVQAEGMTLTDFENISSVFHNRLNNARKYPLLQSDATLQYILDKRKAALTAADLAIDSPYNSYLYPGLPPGSICNPGMDAINCALYPAETKYFYFLADGKGNTYFSETNEQHEALKKEYIG